MINGRLWPPIIKQYPRSKPQTPPDGAAIDVANALIGQFFGPTDVVLIEGITAVYDNVVRRPAGRQDVRPSFR